MKRALKSFKATMDPNIGNIRFDFAKSLWLWAMIAIALVFGLPHLGWAEAAVATTLACVTLCMGHSVGLHRGIIHRTYQTSTWFRGFLAYLFVLTGLGGPITWSRFHAVRDYWQNQPQCPTYFGYRQGLLVDFWWNLHMRFQPADDRAMHRIPQDILTDPWLRFLEKTWPLHQLPIAAVLWLWLGPAAVASAVCGRIAVSIMGHWFISFVSHAWGHSPHTIPGACEQGTNHWLLGVISFGEGFHNNHHAFPGSARMGLHSWQLDLGWLVLLGLQRLCLVRNLQSANGDSGMMEPHFNKASMGSI